MARMRGPMDLNYQMGVPSPYDILAPEQYEAIGGGLQLVANQPKYYSIANQVAQMGDMVPIAHGTKSLESAQALMESGFDPTRKKMIGKTGLPLPQLDDFYNPGLRNEGVFVGVGPKATNVAEMYAKGSGIRGQPVGKQTGIVYKGFAPKDSIQFSRNLFGHLQGKIPAGVANTAFGLGGVQDSGILSAIQKSPATKFLGRFLPGANVVLGYASAANRFAQGQPLRGLAAIGSMIPGPLGYLGLGAETAMDIGASYFNRALQRRRLEAEERRKKDPVVEPKVNPLSRRVTRSVLPTQPQSRSQDTNIGGGPGVTIGAGGGQTRTVDPRSRAAMYSAPTRRSAPPPFRRFNNGGIVSLFGGF